MKRSLLILTLAVICYLGMTFIVGMSIDLKYERVLSGRMMALGKEGFADTPRFSAEIKNDAELHRDWAVLQFTPPVGWFIIYHAQSVEDSFIFASKNMALPESQRFQDVEECRRFGFDPDKKSDDEIIKAIFSKFWCNRFTR